VRGRDHVRGICAACKYLAYPRPACVLASAGFKLMTVPARIMRPVLSDACWAAVMGLAKAWLQCGVSGKSPRLSAISRFGNGHVRCLESLTE
jgi:hypothetical protein